MNPLISVRKIRKKFGNHLVFDNLSFSARKGDIIAIFGPNGCGKSTLLNILAGLVKHDGGTVSMKNNSQQNFSYIFQNYRDSLLPWRTCYQNLSFPLEIKGCNDQQINKKIKELVDDFSFKINLSKYPYQLSGGQQQILAFLRSLITNPELLFMDEPFSALDYENNLLLREYLQRYYGKHKPTIVIITHDIEEAAHLANKIIVLSKNPTYIVNLIRNRAHYPRQVRFLKSKKFNRVKEKVLLAFKKGARL